VRRVNKFQSRVSPSKLALQLIGCSVFEQIGEIIEEEMRKKARATKLTRNRVRLKKPIALAGEREPVKIIDEAELLFIHCHIAAYPIRIVG